MIIAFIHGFILSLGLILPLGPQNLFIFNQGATQPKWVQTLPVVITAALCDTVLIILAVMGVSVFVMTFPTVQLILYLGGFFFLVYMGFTIWKTSNHTMQEKSKALSTRKQITFAISVSLLNPHALMDTIGVIGTSSLPYQLIEEKIAFTIACILVSWLVFLLLSYLGKVLKRLDQSGKWLNLINKISALFIWGVALLIGYYLLSLVS
ncbi:LysE/ArgO family amino acid transporter [Alkalihalobacillus sp. 1P02AB]|uniref:LysE/ArgO family amino acid transporter n=1 Tax=Alkalihalobacillus sp. 1P02AB TaxID=3132260 RepID=UPI0039A5D7A5